MSTMNYTRMLLDVMLALFPFGLGVCTVFDGCSNQTMLSFAFHSRNTFWSSFMPARIVTNNEEV